MIEMTVYHNMNGIKAFWAWLICIPSSFNDRENIVRRIQSAIKTCFRVHSRACDSLTVDFFVYNGFDLG